MNNYLRKSFFLAIGIGLFLLCSCRDDWTEKRSVEGGASKTKNSSEAPVKREIMIADIPEIIWGDVRWDESHTADEEARVKREIAALLSQLLAMVENGNLSVLPRLISQKRGLYVDLKAHNTYEQLLERLSKPDNYLQMFYIDTAALRKYAKDDTRLAVRDVLRMTKTLRVDLFMEGPNECELKLWLVDKRDYSYYLNNPVFIHEDGVWKVYRLF